MKRPKASIVIPMYKSKPYLDKCLPSVLNQSFKSYEVLAVIDGNDTETMEYLNRNFTNPKLRVLLMKQRVWLSGTRAIGISKSRGEFVALLDHDVEVNKNWLAEHIKVLMKDKHIAATQGKTLDMHKRSIIQNVAILFSPQIAWVYCVGFGQVDKSQHDNSRPSLAGATNAVFRRKIVEKIGSYDRELKFNIDDLDLAIRLWIAGYKTVTAPKAVIYHWTAKTKAKRSQMINRSEWEYEFAKTPWIILKNYELTYALFYCPIVITALLARSVYNLRIGNYAPIIGFTKAMFWILFHMPLLLKKRSIIQNRHRKVKDRDWMSQIGIEGNHFTSATRYLLRNRFIARKKFNTSE